MSPQCRPLFGGKTQAAVGVHVWPGSGHIRPFTYRAISGTHTEPQSGEGSPLEVLYMQTTNDKRYYSPQFSELAAVSVRRLAWAIGKPMPAAVDEMVKLLPSIIDSAKVCLACKDNTRCQSCGFYNPSTPQEQAILLAGV